MNMTTAHTARLLITCEDKPGIVQAVSSFLYHQGANITALDQYATEAQGGRYFMRVEFELDHLHARKDALMQTFAANVADRYDMQWKLTFVNELKKVGILVSKVDHALLELLWRHARGSLACEITHVISNHEDLRESVENFGIPFTVVKVTKDNKAEAYAQIHEMMQGNDLLVLARYMQIITPNLISLYVNKIINIHHSFLPAFPGAKPYHSAFKRGVKIIGATSHYVTDHLDEGPIIEQDITRVSHINSIDDFIMKGRDLERIVLARAIKLHAERKTMVYDNKTVVFS